MEYSATPPTDRKSGQGASQIPEILSTLKKAECILIVTHERPDGDAVGSTTGLMRSLRKAGKTVDVAISTTIPENFQFLLAEEKIHKTEDLDEKYDLIFVLDTGDLPRTGFEPFISKTKTKVANIDHHPSNTCFGNFRYLDFEACSTCEMVANFIREAGLPLDSQVAEGLYMGILTDTRFFQNEKIRASAHQIAWNLLSTGLDTSPILSRLTRQRKLSELKILGLGLSKMEVAMDGRLATIVLTKEDFLQCQAPLEAAWSAGLFGQMNALIGVVAGVCLMESPEGKCFCEFRSTGGFDVKEIAVAMGGGGHLAASGCNRVGPFPAFVKEILALVETKLKKFSSPEKGTP